MNQSIIISNHKEGNSNTLSAEQKKFNRLNKSIEKNKKLIEKWSETEDKLRERYTQSVFPLKQELNQLRMDTLILFDEKYQQADLTKRQTEKLYQMITLLVGICIEHDNSGRAEEIYNRYNETSLEDTKKDYFAEMKSRIEDELNIDFGDDFNVDSAESFREFINKVKEKEAQQESRKQERKKKPSAKQKIQQEKEVSENQSIKEIFRQLTKVLHPDREMDETEKDRKNELMQRANVHYNNKDLLGLLGLQFEIEQTNQSHLDNLSNDKLVIYNRLLQKKLQKTTQDIAFIKQKISAEFDIPYYAIKPEEFYYFLNNQKNHLEEQKATFLEDLAIFNDPKRFKKFLNNIRINQLRDEIYSPEEDVFCF